MTKRTYSRLELAENQLRSAIVLFIQGGDRFSVITLAGAADVIFAQLVIRAGKKNFTEISLVDRAAAGAPPQSREEYGQAMNDVLFINQLKHMDKGDDGFLELDPEESALGAILKTLVNYAILEGKSAPLVLAFRAFMVQSLDAGKYNVHCEPDWNPDGKT